MFTYMDEDKDNKLTYQDFVNLKSEFSYYNGAWNKSVERSSI